MMNTDRGIFKDVISIFTSVHEIRKLIVRAIAPKCGLKCSFAQRVTISTTQFGRRAAIVRDSDMVSITVLHHSHQFTGMT